MKYALIALFFLGITKTNAQFTDPSIIKLNQNSAIEKYEELSKFTGSNNTILHKAYIAFSSKQNNQLRIFYDFTAKKTFYQGRNYFNIRNRGEILFSDADRVYIEGEKIFLDIDSSGYLALLKAPGESWTNLTRLYRDFTITVYDDEKRQELLKNLKCLVKHPLYLK